MARTPGPIQILEVAPLATRPAWADRRLLAWSVPWTLAVLAVTGVVSAIIPNPVFGRGLPPEPFAVAVWLASAPLMGLLISTYMPRGGMAPTVARPATRDGSTAGMIGSAAAFLAIGCPTCNKVALLLLGTGGAASIFGPIQPFLGAASLALLGGTLAWRIRLIARGQACAVRS